jgi:hypothetical protein
MIVPTCCEVLTEIAILVSEFTAIMSFDARVGSPYG